jgi:hypothetical protein
MYSYDVTEQELKNQIISKLIDFGYENMGFVYPDTHAATAFLLNEPGIQSKSRQHARTMTECCALCCQRVNTHGGNRRRFLTRCV